MGDAQRDERGADVLAVGEGRQALDMDSEQARERVGLGVTELWELGCDVLNRAMSLAQLDAGQGSPLSDGSGGRREAIVDQCGCQRVGPCRDVAAGCGELDGIPLFELGAALAGELAHRIGAGVLGEKTKC